MKQRKHTIDELKQLVSVFNFRHQFTNDSVLMSGDLKKLNESLDKAKSYNPDLVIPGHDRSFKPIK